MSDLSPLFSVAVRLVAFFFKLLLPISLRCDVIRSSTCCPCEALTRGKKSTHSLLLESSKPPTRLSQDLYHHYSYLLNSIQSFAPAVRLDWHYTLHLILFAEFWHFVLFCDFPIRDMRLSICAVAIASVSLFQICTAAPSFRSSAQGPAIGGHGDNTAIDEEVRKYFHEPGYVAASNTFLCWPSDQEPIATMRRFHIMTGGISMA
jgi:hypothetical protein